MDINNLRDAFERGRPVGFCFFVLFFLCMVWHDLYVYTWSGPFPTVELIWGSVLWVFPVGQDPLAEGSYDLDSVAGVLKLYFRGLERPLFPIESTGHLLEHAGKLV